MRLIATLLCAAALSLGTTPLAFAAAPANGVDYLTLPEVQNTDAGAKVEVTEFFAYYCPHCDRFEPLLAAWVKQHGADIVFKRVHVTGGPSVLPQQKLFYTLEALGLLEQYHVKAFNAMHIERLRLATDQAVFDWAAKAGIDRAKFVDAYNSFGLAAKLRRADRMMGDYRVDSWPMLAVGGHYLTSPTQAGEGDPSAQTEAAQQQAALKVLDFLVAKAKAEKK
ncbi:MAG: thiol:disulfide interchange protein DsbA/DsbL [Pseudomonadota bacterium]|nr:thiol:disulfide interchange protein DsbA/DsbL [Pseudomonadota bacterium]